METAFFKHIFTRYYSVGISFSYWRGKKDQEVDIVAQVTGRDIPFEVKYRHQNTHAGDLKGLTAFITRKNIQKGYVITREINDFGVLPIARDIAILKIPAPLACFWLGQSELQPAMSRED